MKTFKPIATISYCDTDYLKSQLNALVNIGDVEFWSLIYHKKEDVSLKDHVHVFIMPIAKLETRDLQFKQDNLKGTMPYQKSDFGNWFFYCSHNKTYLASKKLQKKYNYCIDEFISSDVATFHSMVASLELDEYINNSDNILRIIKDGVKNGIPFSSLVYSGVIPINQIRNYQRAYDLIWRENEKLNQFKTATSDTTITKVDKEFLDFMEVKNEK